MHLVTKLCHGLEQYSTDWEGSPVYDCSEEEAVYKLVEVGVCLYLDL